MYNVILGRVRATITAVEKQGVLDSLCVFVACFPACNAHAPYCHLWPAKLYNIFPHYLMHGTIFEETLLNTKCVLIFSTTCSNYQLNAQFLYSSTICTLHYDPQHVSSSTLLILRRTNCITTASGIVTLCK